MAVHATLLRAFAAAACAAAFALGGCGGTGQHATPLASGAATGLQTQRLSQATITITIPQRASASGSRKPAFVSPSAQSIAISSYAVVSNVIAASPAATSNQDLTAVSPGCTSSASSISCSVTVPVPIGRVAFSVNVYQGLGQTGALLSTLPQSAATEYTVVEGAANIVLPLVLGGVPNTIVVTPYASTLTGGAPATVPLAVVASDAGGNVIIGAGDYANPITLSDSDGTGSTTLSTTTVTGPATIVSLTYNGGAFTSPATIHASAPGATDTPGLLALQHGVLTLSCAGSCPGLANGSAPYAETVTEGGYGSGSFTVTGSGTSCNFDPAPGSVVASNGSATVNVYPNPAGGTCTLGVSDTNAQNASATLGFNAAGLPTIVTTCYALIMPVDPNGGTLDQNSGCGNYGVQYGSYLSVPLQSSTNPGSFQIAIYANPVQPAIRQFQVGGNRYISNVSVANPFINMDGQNGTSAIPITSFIP